MCTSIQSNSPKEQPMLSLGSRGESVKMMQDLFNELGYYAGDIDGYFCPETENSLRTFQKQIGIPSDGVVNLRTWRAINRVYKFLIG